MIASRTAFDRSLIQRTLLWAIMLAWPLLLFGRPAYYPDSVGYYNGGAKMVAFIGDTLVPLIRSTPTVAVTATDDAARTGTQKGVANADHGTNVTRSMSYSLLAYLFSWPDRSLVLLAILQALVTGFVLAVLLDIAGIRSLTATALCATILTMATSIAPIVSFALPDIFAALFIGIAALLATQQARMSRAVIVALTLIAAFAISAHTSIIAIAIAMILSAIIGYFLFGRRTLSVGALAWTSAALVLGGLAITLSGYIAFKEVSIVPKRLPLMLARSLEDGPAHWYLEEHCPKKHYLVCAMFNDHPPANAGAFLWGENGVVKRATPKQMDQIRDEEQEILLEIAKRYPAQQATSALGNLLTQLRSYSLEDIRYDQAIGFDLIDGAHLEDRPIPPYHNVLPLITRATTIVAILSLIVIAMAFRRLPTNWRAAVALVFVGMLANAAVCAMLSAVANRYEARVIWLLPVLALASVSLVAKRAP